MGCLWLNDEGQSRRSCKEVTEKPNYQGLARHLGNGNPVPFSKPESASQFSPTALFNILYKKTIIILVSVDAAGQDLLHNVLETFNLVSSKTWCFRHERLHVWYHDEAGNRDPLGLS